jgi:hypothetical protein
MNSQQLAASQQQAAAQQQQQGGYDDPMGLQQMPPHMMPQSPQMMQQQQYDMQLGMHPGMQPGMQPGVTQQQYYAMQQPGVMHPGMMQGMPPGMLQPGMHQGMPQGMQPGMMQQPGMQYDPMPPSENGSANGSQGGGGSEAGRGGRGGKGGGKGGGRGGGDGKGAKNKDFARDQGKDGKTIAGRAMIKNPEDRTPEEHAAVNALHAKQLEEDRVALTARKRKEEKEELEFDQRLLRDEGGGGFNGKFGRAGAGAPLRNNDGTVNSKRQVFSGNDCVDADLLDPTVDAAQTAYGGQRSSRQQQRRRPSAGGGGGGGGGRQYSEGGGGARPMTAESNKEKNWNATEMPHLRLADIVGMITQKIYARARNDTDVKRTVLSAFRQFDSGATTADGGSGSSMTQEQLHKTVRAFFDLSLTGSQMDDLFRYVDTNSDGLIDYQDFLVAFTKRDGGGGLAAIANEGAAAYASAMRGRGDHIAGAGVRGTRGLRSREERDGGGRGKRHQDDVETARGGRDDRQRGSPSRAAGLSRGGDGAGRARMVPHDRRANITEEELRILHAEMQEMQNQLAAYASRHGPLYQ